MTAAGFRLEETGRGVKFVRTVAGPTSLTPELTAALRACAAMVKSIQAGDVDAVPAACRCDTKCFRCGGLVTWQAFAEGVPDRVCGGTDDGPCPFREGYARDSRAGDGG
jgi:hypothetical protein